MTYQEEIKGWLNDYKKVHFAGVEDGKWRNYEKPYPHILPKSSSSLNLLSNYRDDFKNSKYAGIKYHTYFHHLNSSQAMCINFFYPLIKEKKLDLVLQVLNLNDDTVNYDKVCFEKESKIEGNRRRTSFDFYFETTLGRKIFFEIKYTEQQFGKAKKYKENSKVYDKGYLKKYNSIYKEHCAPLNSKYSDSFNFLDNYQLMRNLIHLDDNSYVVFVYPEGNKKIKQQAEFAKANFVKPKFEQNVINLTWEQLVRKVDLSEVDLKELKMQMADFKSKYKIQPS